MAMATEPASALVDADDAVAAAVAVGPKAAVKARTLPPLAVLVAEPPLVVLAMAVLLLSVTSVSSLAALAEASDPTAMAVLLSAVESVSSLPAAASPSRLARAVL